jgi:menaquinol-cytochrome c reductase iron-sulfur subunit
VPLVDDLKVPLTDEARARRALLELLIGGAFAAATLGTGVTAVRFLWPEVLFEQETRVRLGRPDEVAPGTVLVLPEQQAYVVRTADGFFAMSAVCTHLGCLTQYRRDDHRIVCPCHGSQFDSAGRVTTGPAPAPLPRLALTLEGGVLVLDLGQPVGADALLKV